MDAWVVVVDDDVSNLKMAGYILSKNNMRVTALKSGRALLDYVSVNQPDLILLDIMMPDMDGFTTLQKLRERETGKDEIPVIFITAAEEAETESRGLKLGAKDFIKKPFIPEVLVLRVRNTIELVRLQRNLLQEVERKTLENESLYKRLSLHIVETMAEAVDAKDTYTHGHSRRGAEYSKEIARRYGYTEKRCNDIYMMALLHDVGKIGVPDAVINKPGRLTEDEFALIKEHPGKGARILKNIKEMPELVIGVRWHHERYDGNGCPGKIFLRKPASSLWQMRMMPCPVTGVTAAYYLRKKYGEKSAVAEGNSLIRPLRISCWR